MTDPSEQLLEEHRKKIAEFTSTVDEAAKKFGVSYVVGCSDLFGQYGIACNAPMPTMKGLVSMLEDYSTKSFLVQIRQMEKK